MSQFPTSNAPDETTSPHRLIQALRGQPHDRVPVWFMRQAGRYLPGYQKVRAKTDFLTLCKTPDLAAEVTIEPLDTFGVDGVIIFSDILVPLEAMGLPVLFTDRGPCMERPLADRGDIDRLSIPDPMAETPFVMEIVQEVKRRVAGRVPVIGFAGAPFTLACYALEGSPSRTFAKTLEMAYRAPDDLHALLDKIAVSVASYLKAQVEAGADAIQLFDTWGGMLAHEEFHQFSLHYCRKILAELDGCGVPRILFIKGAGMHLEDVVTSGSEAIGFDYMTDATYARDLVDGRVALQGKPLSTRTLLPSTRTPEARRESARRLCRYSWLRVQPGTRNHSTHPDRERTCRGRTGARVRRLVSKRLWTTKPTLFRELATALWIPLCSVAASPGWPQRVRYNSKGERSFFLRPTRSVAVSSRARAGTASSSIGARILSSVLLTRSLS